MEFCTPTSCDECRSCDCRKYLRVFGLSIRTTTNDAKIFATAAVSAVDKLSKAIVSTAIVGEEPVRIQTASFSVASQRQIPAALEAASVSVSDASAMSIAVPSGAFNNQTLLC